jgi:segregation and condensation protein A
MSPAAAKPESPAPAEVRPDAAGELSYRVSLDAYCGPLDLLLYLIRKEEVDIYDIPIARIAEQYQRYVELMAELNVNVAGEFLVMAATLMEIKSRMLLPLERGLEEEEEDPRAELVRQLLEYKRYRDLARELGSRAAEQALKFGRPARPMSLAEAEAGEAGSRGRAVICLLPSARTSHADQPAGHPVADPGLHRGQRCAA